MTASGTSPRIGRAAIAAFAFLAVLGLTPAGASMPRDELADTVERVRPSVVSIAAITDLQIGAAGDLERSDDASGPGEVATLGAGVLIDPAGHVVTSGHVTANARRVLVTLVDGRTFDAAVIGMDDETDLAVLKIAAPGPFPYARWGDSNAARVGEWVIAIGNPFGLEGSVTAGILSARGRSLKLGELDDYLQVDAPTHRGSSGGPLFDRHGQVIGINALLYTSDSSSVGIGFALPSAIAEPTVEALRQHGRVDRGWLGVQVQEVTPDIAASLALGATAGALVLAVDPKSPADQAGLRLGDVILAVEGRRVARHRDLVHLIAAFEPDRVVTLDVWRDGRPLTATARLTRLGVPEPTARRPVPGLGVPTPVGALGVTLGPLDPEARTRWLIPDAVTGAVVVAVAPGGAAAGAALLVGDVVIRIGHRSVGSAADLDRGVADAMRSGRTAALLLIYRRGGARFVGVPLERE